jgi:hypothetical protein
MAKPATASEREMARQNRLRRAGKCIRCRGRRHLYSHLCDACRLRQIRTVRKREGRKPWRPGGPGRPPKWAA